MKQSLLFFVLLNILAYKALCADGIWEAYRSELFAFFKGGRAGEGMQLLKTPIEAVYDLGNTQTLADIMNPVSKWGPIRDFVPNEYLQTQYFDFISNLKISPASPSVERDINNQKALLVEAHERAEVEKEKCNKKFERMIAMNIPTDREAFEHTFCGAYNNVKREVLQLEGGLRSMTANIPDQDIRDAQIKLNKAVSVESFPWRESLSSLKTFRDRITKDMTNTFQITINKSTVKNTESKVEWTSLTEKDSFIQTSSGKSLSLSSSSNTFTLDIRASGYYAVNVVPEDWFSARVVEKHKNGPFIDAAFAKRFFGKDKQLSMIPSTLYLLYKPEIILQVGSEDVEFFRNTKVVHIGPFFGRVVSIKETTESGDSSSSPSKSYKVVVRDSRDQPLIVAVDNKIF